MTSSAHLAARFTANGYYFDTVHKQATKEASPSRYFQRFGVVLYRDVYNFVFFTPQTRRRRKAKELYSMGAEQSTEGAPPDTQRAIEGGAHKYAQKSADAAKLLPKTVKDLDDDQLGELVASVLDFYTKHYGSIPTNPELIKMAQKALSELNIQGDLMEREKDIAKIVDVLLEEDAA